MAGGGLLSAAFRAGGAAAAPASVDAPSMEVADDDVFSFQGRNAASSMDSQQQAWEDDDGSMASAARNSQDTTTLAAFCSPIMSQRSVPSNPSWRGSMTEPSGGWRAADSEGESGPRQGGQLVRSLSRPMLIPGNEGTAVLRSSTYQPTSGGFMEGFVPPHELVADDAQQVVGSLRQRGASYRGTPSERIKSLVFQHTGIPNLSSAQSFLSS